MKHEEILLRLRNATQNGANHWMSSCPCTRNHNNQDEHKSLSITYDSTAKKTLLNCHTGCTIDEICQSLGIERKDLFENDKEITKEGFFLWYAEQNNLKYIDKYDYRNGTYKARFLKDGKKVFYWFHDESSNKSGLAVGRGNKPHSLYIQGNIKDNTIYVVEGEKDAKNLYDLTGVTTVSSENGASNTATGGKWYTEYNEQIKGKDIYIFNDNDKKGRNFALSVAEQIKDICNVKMISIDAIWNDCPEGGDISDFIESVGRIEARKTIIKSLSEAIPIESDRTNKEEPKESGAMEESNEQKETTQDPFNKFIEKIQTEAYKPIQTGISSLDKFLNGGIYKQSLVILSSAPGTGKTTLTQQIFETMARNGHSVIYLNLEMSEEQLYAKSLSRLLYDKGEKISHTTILKGYKWTAEQKKKIKSVAYDYYENISNNLEYNPTGCKSTYQSILDTIHKKGQQATAEGKKAPIIVLDYLHLVTSQNKEEQSEIIKKIVIGLKKYAIMYDTFVFVISANNRTSNKSPKIGLSDGRDTSAIEYTADIQLSLNFKELSDEEKKPDGTFYSPSDPDDMAILQRNEPRNMVVQVLKSRMSAPGGKLYLQFYPKYNSFYVDDEFKPFNSNPPFK